MVLIQERNEDMNELFNEEMPEVTILGANHSKYLKEQDPEVHFSYFRPKDIFKKIQNISMENAADSVHIIDEFNPENKSEY